MRLPLVLALILGCRGQPVDEQLDISASSANPDDAGASADVDPAKRAMLMDRGAARLVGRVLEAVSRRPGPCRVLVVDGGGTEPGAVLSGVGFWSDGRYSLAALPGPARVKVSRGRRFTEATKDVMLNSGKKARLDLTIGVPEKLRFESQGWHGVDLYRPVASGKALRVQPTLELLAQAARGEGVALSAASFPWSLGEWRTGKVDIEDVRAACSDLSDETLTLVPTWSGMNAPFYGRTFYIGGTAPRRFARAGWDLRWPNFLAFEEARRQGALSVATHLTGAREMDPRADVTSLMPDLAEYYKDSTMALEGGAWELPFDVAAGLLPDCLALSATDEDQAVWHSLLNMGHRIPAIHVDVGSFGEGVLPSERTFVNVGQGKELTAASMAEAVRAGRILASNGPFVFLTIDGKGPGSVVKADGTPKKLLFTVYSSTERGAQITKLELVRNGRVVESEPGSERNYMSAVKLIAENEPAWYIARARAGPPPGRVAWTSPVYFEAKGHSPPKPVETFIKGRIIDAKTGAPLEADVQATVLGEVVASARSSADGRFTIRASPAARLDVSAPGHSSASARVFFYTRAPQEIRSLHTNASGRGTSALADRRTYERMRLACAEAEIDFRLDPE